MVDSFPTMKSGCIRPDVQAELNEAIAWTEENPPEDTNFEELEARGKR